MSHFTRVQTSLKDRETLVQALEELGYVVQQGGVQVRGWGGQMTSADLKIATSNPQHDIGFQLVGDSYQLVADWYGIHDTNEHALVQQVTQRYAYVATQKTLTQQGFTVAEEEQTEDGSVRLVLRRVA